MGLFSLPPAQSRADLNLDLFLGGNDGGKAQKIMRRVMPAEWFPQSAVQLTWPHENTDWAYMLQDVTACYVRMAFEIATREKLIIVAPDVEAVKTLLEERLPRRATENISYAACPTNDTWARDHAFITVIGEKNPELLDYRFNGWGGKFEASLDNAINRHLFEEGIVGGEYKDCLDFELEGGSIESDGQGLLLTTSRCLLNDNRNASMTKEDIEQRLKADLGVEKILWLNHGELSGDDTDAHVDTLARLCPDDAIVYVSCDDTEDPHYEELKKMEEELQAFRTQSGAPFCLIPVPLPDAIYDEDGLRLPATYANFLIMNTAVLYPTYAQPEKDEATRQALQRAFPKADLVGIDCRPLIRQHGSLHCATMQYPKGVVK